MVSGERVFEQEPRYEICLVGTKAGCGRALKMPVQEFGSFVNLSVAKECKDALADWLRCNRWNDILDVCAGSQDDAIGVFSLPETLLGLGAQPHKVMVCVVRYGAQPDSAPGPFDEAEPHIVSAIRNRVAAVL